MVLLCASDKVMVIVMVYVKVCIVVCIYYYTVVYIDLLTIFI